MSGFTSFVDYDEGEKPIIAVANQLSNSFITPSSSKKQINLFKKEIEICSSNNVSFSMQFGESEQGKVICTDVRLRFTPIIQKKSSLPPRSKWFDDLYDVPLCNIASLSVSLVKSTSKGKRAKFQKMLQNFSSMETVSIIRLTLKDMRVVTIDFRRSQNGTDMANQMFFFSKCGPIDKMVQVGVANGEEETKNTSKLPFNNMESWMTEMKRCGLKYDSSAPWRVCSINKEGFTMIPSGYPMYVVLPTYLARTDIDRLMQNWKLGRLPVWVWSRKNHNSALMICSENETNLATPELLAKLTESVVRCHPDNERPFCMHLEKNFAQSVGDSYNNLLKFCSIDSYEQIVKKQSNWQYTKHHSGWLHLINKCLSTTRETFDWIVSRDRTVILFEEEGRDMSLIVASLTQICCDPYYRSQEGFQNLVEKMWIAFGHPFGQRMLGRDDELSQKLKSTTKSMTSQTQQRFQIYPTWLLFLDCVGQLYRLNEIQFEFSHHFLIALWDLSQTGIVPAFTCNNLTEQLAYGIVGGPFPMDKYFDGQYCQMFRNIWNDAAHFSTSAQKYFPKYGSGRSLLVELIYPPTTIANVELWNECYLRWISTLNMKNCGAIKQALELDEKMLKLSQKLRCVKWERRIILPEIYSTSHPYCLPETSRSIISLTDSLSSEFEMIKRPDEYDGISLTSSMASISFTQTPIHGQITPMFDAPKFNETRMSDEGNASISMQTKQQIVKFSKNDEDSMIETPILGGGNSYPTPARRNIINHSTPARPIPPPRPSNLTTTNNDTEYTNMITRF